MPYLALPLPHLFLLRNYLIEQGKTSKLQATWLGNLHLFVICACIQLPDADNHIFTHTLRSEGSFTFYRAFVGYAMKKLEKLERKLQGYSGIMTTRRTFSSNPITLTTQHLASTTTKPSRNQNLLQSNPKMPGLRSHSSSRLLHPPSSPPERLPRHQASPPPKRQTHAVGHNHPAPSTQHRLPPLYAVTHIHLNVFRQQIETHQQAMYDQDFISVALNVVVSFL